MEISLSTHARYPSQEWGMIADAEEISWMELVLAAHIEGEQNA